MSHALDFSAGKAAIAFAGELPWHGFGERITPNMTLAQMRKAASLNWHVQELDAFYMHQPQPTRSNKNPEPVMMKAPNRKTLVRSDTGDFLSHMSENKYEVRQPEMIVEFFRDICETGGFQIETLGALHGGKRVWCMASRKGGASELSGLIKPNILLADSYDGSMATIAKFTTVTVVCQNTLSMARADGKKEEIRIGHHQKFDEQAVKAQLGEIDNSFASFLDQMHAFSKVKMSPAFKERFFLKLFAKPEVFGESKGKGKAWKTAKLDFDAASTASKTVVKELLRLSEEGNAPGSDFFNGSLYNALQTVTYYQDHEARSKGNLRWQSALLGNGNATKDAAHELAMSLID
jgi:phage/plasmid-like protein (TIGR03299 family)